MREIRILITGVGRRIELIQELRKAALSLDVKLYLYGADMAGEAPALAYCDFTRKVCAMKATGYIDELVKICVEDKIDLVLPTIDTDLLVLSEHIDCFEKVNTKVLISSPDMIRVCRDKNNTGAFFEACGVRAPKTYNDYREYDGDFPCFIKPKDGSSSINAYKVNSEEELQSFANMVEDYIIQPFVAGREYTIDAFCDYDGNPVYITPRERLQVRAGEVLKTQICMDDTMIEECRKIIDKFKPCGPITVQLIQDEKTGENYYIEINPRYGGGSPLSMKAGARSSEALLKLILGEKTEYAKANMNQAIFSRFDQSVCIKESDVCNNIKGVIFDLDDTLYSERDYVRSGYSKIADYLGDMTAADRMYELFLEGKAAIDAYLEENDSIDKKAECLKIYREQLPDIILYDGITNLLAELRSKGIKIGIITDGRIEGQKKKIEALGLSEYLDDCIITDELGGVQFRKPNDISFRIMQNRWKIPFEQIIYVGDNLSKDFQAPRQLGIRSLWFNNPDGLYTRNNKNNTDLKAISSISEMSAYIANIISTIRDR